MIFLGLFAVLSLQVFPTNISLVSIINSCKTAFKTPVFRFEKLDITPKSAQKIKPVLEKWMREIDGKLQANTTNALTQHLANTSNEMLCHNDDEGWG